MDAHVLQTDGARFTNGVVILIAVDGNDLFGLVAVTDGDGFLWVVLILSQIECDNGFGGCLFKLHAFMGGDGFHWISSGGHT